MAERGFQLGKIQNLRIACRALDGLVIPAGAVFSVWRHLGAPIAARGYVPGRMLKQGCMVPSIGGGLCQLSNALYDAALQAGCRIVERHSHSRIVPGSAAASGRDATLAWNYVDLRFAPDREMRLSARLDRESLVIRLLAPAKTAEPLAPPVEPAPRGGVRTPPRPEAAPPAMRLTAFAMSMAGPPRRVPRIGTSSWWTRPGPNSRPISATLAGRRIAWACRSTARGWG